MINVKIVHLVAITKIRYDVDENLILQFNDDIRNNIDCNIQYFVYKNKYLKVNRTLSNQYTFKLQKRQETQIHS